MALFIGFLIIVGLLFWAIKLKPLGIILCSLFVYLLISSNDVKEVKVPDVVGLETEEAIKTIKTLSHGNSLTQGSNQSKYHVLQLLGYR